MCRSKAKPATDGRISFVHLEIEKKYELLKFKKKKKKKTMKKERKLKKNVSFI